MEEVESEHMHTRTKQTQTQKQTQTHTHPPSNNLNMRVPAHTFIHTNNIWYTMSAKEIYLVQHQKGDNQNSIVCTHRL